MSELLNDIQTYWDMRAGGFSDASMEERKTTPGQRWDSDSGRPFPISFCIVAEKG